MLIQRCAVKTGQCMGVPWEMSRHPVQDDPNTALMQQVDKIAEVIGAAKAL